jgi:hypothetical protein
MIPTNDERIERQLYAAYRLILSWPKVDTQQQQPDQLATACEDGAQDDSEILRPDQGDV